MSKGTLRASRSARTNRARIGQAFISIGLITTLVLGLMAYLPSQVAAAESKPAGRNSSAPVLRLQLRL